MDASVLGTGSLVLNKAMSALNLTRSGANTVPGYSNGGFITQNGLGRIDASIFSLRFNLALPTGAPADFPMALIYNSASGGSTEYGNNWSAPYHRYAENDSPLNLLTPTGIVHYTSISGTNTYAGSPNNLNNTLTGSATTGWVETQPDGTTFNYATTGQLATIRNNAGVRWTLTWNSGATLVQHIDGPFGRRTSFTYNASNSITRIQDPSGRITSLTVNASGNLVRIVTPELCSTSLVYDSNNDLIAWVDPLGFRTTYQYSVPGTVGAVIQPLGQRTSYTGGGGHRPFVTYPTLGQTKMTLSLRSLIVQSIANPVGNRTTYVYAFTGSANTSGYLGTARDARNHRTTISYQPVGNGATAIYPTAIQTPISQYQYRYNSNNQTRGRDRRTGQPFVAGLGQLREPDCRHRPIP